MAGWTVDVGFDPAQVRARNAEHAVEVKGALSIQDLSGSDWGSLVDSTCQLEHDYQHAIALKDDALRESVTCMTAMESSFKQRLGDLQQLEQRQGEQVRQLKDQLREKDAHIEEQNENLKVERAKVQDVTAQCKRLQGEVAQQAKEIDAKDAELVELKRLLADALSMGSANDSELSLSLEEVEAHKQHVTKLESELSASKTKIKEQTQLISKQVGVLARQELAFAQTQQELVDERNRLMEQATVQRGAFEESLQELTKSPKHGDHTIDLSEDADGIVRVGQSFVPSSDDEFELSS